MAKFFWVCCFLLLISCSEKVSKNIYQGKLEELIVGDFSIEKDSLTQSIHNIRVVNDGENEFIVTTASARQFKGWAFVFRSTETGEEVNRIEIPTDGPESMKGGILMNFIGSDDRMYLVNQQGDIGEYNEKGKQIDIYPFLKLSAESKGEVYPLSRGNHLLNFYQNEFQLGLNPNFVTNRKDNPAPGEQKSQFPIHFKNWIISINIETGVIQKSDFSIPVGYEKFKTDLLSTSLFGDWDSKRNLFYLVWPRTAEIYVLDGVQLKEKITPESNFEYNYMATEAISWGGNWTAWVLPKESSQNIFLLYDESKDLILKCSKINESGTGETKFERTKHYVLSIYSGEWEPLGEYLFDFESELDLENWFLTSQGLFINKPEQKSEDEYEFCKIDLSRFVD